MRHFLRGEFRGFAKLLKPTDNRIVVRNKNDIRFAQFAPITYI